MLMQLSKQAAQSNFEQVPKKRNIQQPTSEEFSSANLVLSRKKWIVKLICWLIFCCIACKTNFFHLQSPASSSKVNYFLQNLDYTNSFILYLSLLYFYSFSLLCTDCGKGLYGKNSAYSCNCKTVSQQTKIKGTALGLQRHPHFRP